MSAHNHASSLGIRPLSLPQISPFTDPFKSLDPSYFSSAHYAFVNGSESSHGSFINESRRSSTSTTSTIRSSAASHLKVKPVRKDIAHFVDSLPVRTVSEALEAQVLLAADMNIESEDTSKGIEKTHRRTESAAPDPLILFPSPPDHKPFQIISAMPSSSSQAPSISAVSFLPKPSPKAGQDKSYLRWSQTETSYSEFAAPSHSAFSFHGDPSETHHNQPQDTIKQQKEDRSSVGTFGKSRGGGVRRWSAFGSVSSRDGHPQMVDEEIDELDSVSQNDGSRSARRPQSMSSVSGSGCSNPLDHSISISAVLRSQINPNLLALPRKVSHKTPETDQAITSHLLKTAAANHSRIVPLSQTVKDNTETSGNTLPPAGILPLKDGSEEGGTEYSSDVGYGGYHGRKNDEKRGSKLDQMLGEGAETARVLLDFERRIIQKAEKVSFPNSPLNTARHRPSHSNPIPNSSPQKSHHLRSTSLDSLSSYPPSLSDSITTLTRLLPPTHPAPSTSLPAIPPKPPSRADPIFTKARNDLSPDERTLLRRRTRKLEQVLGEALPEDRVLKHVIRPAGETGLSRIDEGWPVDHEGDRQGYGKGNMKSPRMDENTRDGRFDGLKVDVGYGDREMKSGERRGSDNVAGEGRDGAERRLKRMQVAKLHRLLGTQIPPGVINSSPISTTSSPSLSIRTSSPSTGSYISFDDLPRRLSAETGWANKIRQFSLKDRVNKTSSAPVIGSGSEYGSGNAKSAGGGSFMDIGLGSRRLSDEEKQVVRRRAQKPEQVFGNTPPQAMFFPSPPDVVQRSSAQYEKYQTSLQNLIYLVENDPSRLSDILDSLDETDFPGLQQDTQRDSPYLQQDAGRDSPISPLLVSPLTPFIPTLSTSYENGTPETKLKNLRSNKKLSHFFGESACLSGMESSYFRRDGSAGKGEMGRLGNRLDSVLGDLWGSVVRDGRVGGIGVEEVGKLREMIDVFTRKRAGLRS